MCLLGLERLTDVDPAKIRAAISLYTQKRQTIILSLDIYKFRSVNQSVETFPFAQQSWGIQPFCQELHEVE